MAGVKGRSGGRRAGAGRKPEPPQSSGVASGDDPVAFLLGVMNDADADARLRVRAAGLAAQYTLGKRGDAGKKGERQSAAEDASSGQFKAGPGPRLVVHNR